MSTFPHVCKDLCVHFQLYSYMHSSVFTCMYSCTCRRCTLYVPSKKVSLLVRCPDFSHVHSVWGSQTCPIY